MRLVCLVGGCLGMLGCTSGPPYFIPGTATLPACTTAPAFELDATQWSDSGLVTIESMGCNDATPNETFSSCSLDWAFASDGADYRILVDSEYEIKARLCGSELSLEGGFWLPVEDEGQCTYEDDSAAEVGIEMAASTLTISESAAGPLVAEGPLALRGPCNARYDVTLTQLLQL